MGAALAETGLKRGTALGTATLLVAANAPDVDVLSLLWGAETGLWFRRGVTHGLPALFVLPFVVTGFMVLWDKTVRRRRGHQPQKALNPGQILLLSFIAMATHPILDFLNTYGMRWFMPFSDRWYYGDTLFIVDPWIWAMLAGGVFIARRRRGEAWRGEREAARREKGKGKREKLVGPSIVALAGVLVYIMIMASSSLVARRIVSSSVLEQGVTPERMMVAPMAVNPFKKWVVVEDAEVYWFGTFRWLGRPTFELMDIQYDKHPSHPAAGAAMRGPAPRKFLSWARFPYYVVEERSDEYVVRIADARYTLDPEAVWGAMEVRIESVQ